MGEPRWSDTEMAAVAFRAAHIALGTAHSSYFEALSRLPPRLLETRRASRPQLPLDRGPDHAAPELAAISLRFVSYQLAGGQN